MSDYIKGVTSINMSLETYDEDIAQARAESRREALEEAWEPFSRVDNKDIAWLLEHLGDSGHGKFWRGVILDIVAWRNARALAADHAGKEG